MSEAMKSVIRGLWRQGNKVNEISEILELNVFDVHRVLNEYNCGDWAIKI